MSTHTYAAEDYGMVLTEKALMALSSKEFDMSPEEIIAEGEWGVYCDLAEKRQYDYISNFSGEALFIDDNGYDGESVHSYDYDTVYYISVSRYPHIIGDAAYKNVSEIVDEFRERLGDELPDYDIRGNICHIIGCCYG